MVIIRKDLVTVSLNSGIHIKELEPGRKELFSLAIFNVSCARGAMLVSHSEEFRGLSSHIRSFLTKNFL